MAVYMLVLGAGIGLCMQMLTIIVQNTVGLPRPRRRDLRRDVLPDPRQLVRRGDLRRDLRQPARRTVCPQAAGRVARASIRPPSTTPEALHAQPAAQIAPIVDAYADAIHVVFLAAVPVALVAFVLALFLKEVPLRGTARAGAADVGDGFGMPDGADSAAQLQVAIAWLFRQQGTQALPAVRAASGTTLDVSDGWCVGQVHLRTRLGADASLAAISRRVRVPAEVLDPAFQRGPRQRLPDRRRRASALTEAGRREIEASSRRSAVAGHRARGLGSGRLCRPGPGPGTDGPPVRRRGPRARRPAPALAADGRG